MNAASPALDPRIHAFRPDLADMSLHASVKAERYVEPVMRRCVKGVVPLLAAPEKDARQVSELRYGEFVDVFETREDGFSWVQNKSDRYVGYLRTEGALTDTIADLTCRISALRTFVYAEADLKSSVIDELTLGAHIAPGKNKGHFMGLPGGGYVFAGHVVPAEHTLIPDYVFTAGRMLNVPYLWGGRTPKGLDCSGLVQLVLEMAGFDVPRDSDQQREAFGKPLLGHWRDMPWKRGDVVFFPGHVGIMTSADFIIHAHAHAMEVTAEPLLDVVTRGHEILAAGRP